MKNSIDATTSVIPVIGRLLIAAIFLISGVGKIGAPEATIGYIGSMGMPFPALAYAAAIVIEVGGGLLLVLGYQARLAALALAVFTIVAALVFHRAVGDQNQMIHLLKNIAITGGLLQVLAFGAGAYSLDNRKAGAAQASAA